jgi:hypothetical protein
VRNEEFFLFPRVSQLKAKAKYPNMSQAIDEGQDSKAVTKASSTEITILTIAFLHDRALLIS